MRRFGARTALAVLLCTPLAAHAATIQSNGTGGGDWNTASSWAGGIVPVPADDVSIVSGDVITISSGTVLRTAPTGIEFIDLSNFGQLNIGPVSAALLVNESLLAMSGAIVVGGSGQQSSSIENHGTLTCSPHSAFTNYGTIRNQVGGVIEIHTDVMNNAGAIIENSGTITIFPRPAFEVRGAITNSGLIRNLALVNLEPTIFGWWGAIISNLDSGVLINQGETNVARGATIDTAGGGVVNIGTINSRGVLNFYSPGSETAYFENHESATLNNNPSDDFIIDGGSVTFDVARGQNEGTINSAAQFHLYNTTFTNASGQFFNDDDPAGLLGVHTGATFANGFCARLTNNSAIQNDGLIANCGLIDGTTGQSGIGGSGSIDESNCGGGASDATIEVRVTDSLSGDPIPDSSVYLQRTCLPMGSRVPFQAVAGGSANYFLGAIVPGKYEVKVFAPGYATLFGRLVEVESMDDHIEGVELVPDPNSVNTLRVDISVNTGGNLLTDNFQVTQAGGDPFQPVVTIDGLTMSLVGLGYGDTQADALVEGFSVTPANVTFQQSAPGTIFSSESAISVGDSGLASGHVVFAAPPPNLSGFKLHFKRKTEGTEEPIAGQPITGADHVYGSSFLGPTANPSVFEYHLLEVSAATHYVVLANDQNTIISNVPEVAIAEFPAVTPVPDLEITLPGDDTDGDGLPNTWETSKGLNASSSASPNGAVHDKETDGLTNIEEFTLDIHPGLIDTDGDGHADGFERYAHSDPKVPDSPPLMSEVFVRKDFAEPIKVGTAIRPVVTIAAANGRVAHGGTIKIQNPGGTVIAFPGAMTLGTGNKAMTLRIDNPTGPRVRLGASN